MIKNKTLICILLLGVFLLTLSLVNAVTVVNPASSSTISGTAVLNATNTSLPQMLNCTFYAMSTSTANSSWTLLGTATNITNNALNINRTFNSLILEDSNDYSFNATCRNSSNAISDGTTTSVIIDNTVPQSPTSLSPATATTDTDGIVTFSATVIGVNVTGCTLFFPDKNPGQSSYSMTHSANTCTYSSLTLPQETYNWYVRATDGTNTSDSSRIYVISNIRSSSSSGLTPYIQTNSTLSQKVGGVPVWLIIVVIIIIIWLILRKKK